MPKIMSFTSMGYYRKPVMHCVINRLGKDLIVYSGVTPPDTTIKTLDVTDLGFIKLSNSFFWGAILFQNIPFLKYILADILLIDLNPRIVTNWPVLLIRRMLGKPTVVWGHAWSIGGYGSIGDRVRGMQRRLASRILCYTKTQASEMMNLYNYKKEVFSAPNALYNASNMNFDLISDRKYIIYVGRLVKKKKPEVLLKSFVNIMNKIDHDIELIFIGDGPLKVDMMVLSKNGMSSDRVRFLGHIDDYEILKSYYDKAICSVSPGYVGLSITQSFSFGVPMVISRDEPHSPEIEAAIEGLNCAFFDTNDADALGNKIIEFCNERDIWRKKGGGIVNNCRENYSVENMAEGIISSLSTLHSKNQ